MPKKRKRKSSAPPLLVKGVTAASLAKAAAVAAATSNNKRSRSTPKKNDDSSNTNSSRSRSEEFSSTAESLAFISEYHTLNKRLEQNERDTSISQAQRIKNSQRLHQQQAAMGGLQRYQQASIYGAKSSQFVCADWVVPLLLQTRLKKNNPKQTRKKLRILDVGAIDNQYFGKGHDDWLEVVPIDLQGGQHASVLQVDFFDYAHEYCLGRDLAAGAPLPSNTTQQSLPTPTPFDAIVMSLVLNFQGDPRLRGDMLALAADPRLLKAAPSPLQRSSSHNSNDDEDDTEDNDFPGMLFVALPLASLDNSRYCDMERFLQVVTNPLFQLELVETKRSSKLILLAFQRKHKKKEEEDIINDTKSKSKNSGQKQTKQPSDSYCYNAQDKTFDYGSHEMKRLQPPKPGAKRNNFAVILKSSHNRETAPQIQHQGH